MPRSSNPGKRLLTCLSCGQNAGQSVRLQPKTRRQASVRLPWAASGVSSSRWDRFRASSTPAMRTKHPRRHAIGASLSNPGGLSSMQTAKTGPRSKVTGERRFGHDACWATALVGVGSVPLSVCCDNTAWRVTMQRCVKATRGVPGGSFMPALRHTTHRRSLAALNLGHERDAHRFDASCRALVTRRVRTVNAPFGARSKWQSTIGPR